MWKCNVFSMCASVCLSVLEAVSAFETVWATIFEVVYTENSYLIWM